MRTIIVLASILILGALTAACAYWAGVSQGAPIAFALAGLALCILGPVGINQLGDWGEPGDEPTLRWRHTL